MNINEKFGKEIRKIRESKKVSQESFALSINMDRSYCAKIEQGKHNITLAKMEDIAKGLNVPMSELMKLVEKM